MSLRVCLVRHGETPLNYNDNMANALAKYNHGGFRDRLEELGIPPE